MNAERDHEKEVKSIRDTESECESMEMMSSSAKKKKSKSNKHTAIGANPSKPEERREASEFVLLETFLFFVLARCISQYDNVDAAAALPISSPLLLQRGLVAFSFYQSNSQLIDDDDEKKRGLELLPSC